MSATAAGVYAARSSSPHLAVHNSLTQAPQDARLPHSRPIQF